MQCKKAPPVKATAYKVAALAGVPNKVIKAAKHKLQQLESRDHQAEGTRTPIQSLLALPEPVENPALTKLSSINPDNLTPKQALDLLYELKRLS